MVRVTKLPAERVPHSRSKQQRKVVPHFCIASCMSWYRVYLPAGPSQWHGIDTWHDKLDRRFLRPRRCQRFMALPPSNSGHVIGSSRGSPGKGTLSLRRRSLRLQWPPPFSLFLGYNRPLPIGQSCVLMTKPASQSRR
jgi:hypothetical protein